MVSKCIVAKFNWINQTPGFEYIWNMFFLRLLNSKSKSTWNKNKMLWNKSNSNGSHVLQIYLYIYISHVGILGVKQIFRWYKKGTIRTEAGICLKGIQYKQNYKSFARIVLIVRNCMQSLQHRANSTIDPIRSSLIVKVSHISSSTSDDFIARFLSWKNPKNPLHLSIGISHQVAQHMYIHIYASASISM